MELKKSKRTISKIILHCSATPEGRDVSVDTIRDWHLSRGWRDIGYHYVIYLDGTMVNGRDVNITGAHTKGENEGSIGICYVGGVNESFDAKDTRTPEQRLALDNLLTALLELYPKAKIHGHNEFARKACPSFDARVEYDYLNNPPSEPEFTSVKPDEDMDDFDLPEDFADFVDELTNDAKNDNACSIDNPDCEGCGS